MQLPFFYTPPLSAAEKIIVLSEENSKHIVQVLRMENGEQIRLTDGAGNLYTAKITDAHKKKCTVNIISSQFQERGAKNICIAVSPVKNNSRFEWFLEKATELGVAEIVPLLCTRTEKQHLKPERLQGILISAMLQSQQAWLPVLHEAIKYEKFIDSFSAGDHNKYIAHCLDEKKVTLKNVMSVNQQTNQSTILIGPEGDFTTQEIDIALKNNFVAVSLGNTRLRTETAALTAAVLFCADQ